MEETHPLPAGRPCCICTFPGQGSSRAGPRWSVCAHACPTAVTPCQAWPSNRAPLAPLLQLAPAHPAHGPAATSLPRLLPEGARMPAGRHVCGCRECWQADEMRGRVQTHSVKEGGLSKKRMQGQRGPSSSNGMQQREGCMQTGGRCRWSRGAKLGRVRQQEEKQKRATSLHRRWPRHREAQQAGRHVSGWAMRL